MFFAISIEFFLVHTLIFCGIFIEVHDFVEENPTPHVDDSFVFQPSVPMNIFEEPFHVLSPITNFIDKHVVEHVMEPVVDPIVDPIIEPA